MFSPPAPSVSWLQPPPSRLWRRAAGSGWPAPRTPRWSGSAPAYGHRPSCSPPASPWGWLLRPRQPFSPAIWSAPASPAPPPPTGTSSSCPTSSPSRPASCSLAFRPFAPCASRLQLLGAGVGLYVLGIAFAWAMRAWRGRAAFGQGDVKLIAGLGMILPAGLIGPAVLAGAVSALASACLPARRSGQAIALGLHLVLGSAVALGAAAAFPSLVGR